MSDAAPRRIGRYEIVRAIGEGGMAVVWLARDPELGREVAVKTVKLVALPEALQRSMAERFRNEARAVAMLRHPSIVAVHDTGLDDELGLYSVYEFVKGASLRERLDREPGGLPLEDAARVVRALGEALEVAHRAGVIHRDVKPGNVLLADDGTVKLADFGVARIPDLGVTREGTFLGTPSYAAPEALTKGLFRPASDVWGFGVVAYETLTGRHPFPGDDVESVSNLVLHGAIEPPLSIRPEMGRAASDLVMRALDRNPDERIGSAAQLGNLLGDALLDPQRRAPGVGPRSRQLVGLLALVVAVVAIGLATRAVLEGGSEPAEEPDASVVARERRGRGPAVREQVPVPVPPRVADAAAPDVEERPLDPRSEEERIKELLDRARRLRASGDAAGARRAIDEVLRIDSAHPEARALLRTLGPPEAAGATAPAPHP